MHIPDNHRAIQLLEGLDADRKSFVTALAARYGALSPAQIADFKVLKQTFTLELQARLSPDVAARIAYTSEDALIPLAVALVRIKAEKAAAEERKELITKFATIFGITLATLVAGYLLWSNLATPAAQATAPATSSSPAPASGTSGNGSSGSTTPQR